MAELAWNWHPFQQSLAPRCAQWFKDLWDAEVKWMKESSGIMGFVPLLRCLELRHESFPNKSRVENLVDFTVNPCWGWLGQVQRRLAVHRDPLPCGPARDKQLDKLTPKDWRDDSDFPQVKESDLDPRQDLYFYQFLHIFTIFYVSSRHVPGSASSGSGGSVRWSMAWISGKILPRPSEWTWSSRHIGISKRRLGSHRLPGLKLLPLLLSLTSSQYFSMFILFALWLQESHFGSVANVLPMHCQCVANAWPMRGQCRPVL